MLQIQLPCEYEARRQVVAVKDELHLAPANLREYRDFCLSIGVTISVDTARRLIEILTAGEKR